MAVPAMYVVDAGLAAVFIGGLLLLALAVWWSRTGDGVEIPRERWPGLAKAAAAVGWALFAGGIFLQILGHFSHVGVARW
ncbi:MAG: hypothetical protein HYV62_06685 [Candidatus Rokubacteria bacterium]|nr:hypothetical protein [Candidatus Rokubacteria bacterium]